VSKNLLVGILGNRDSGKTTTWNSLFGKVVHTGKQERRLYISETEYVMVFLVSGSSEERKAYVGDLITVKDPRIVLCSFQYRHGVSQSLSYFFDREYSSVIHWLNPGYHDSDEYGDCLGLIPQLLRNANMLGIRDGRMDVEPRIKELREYIVGWARPRGLLLSDV
jgi:hypothetical protein